MNYRKLTVDELGREVRKIRYERRDRNQFKRLKIPSGAESEHKHLRISDEIISGIKVSIFIRKQSRHPDMGIFATVLWA